MLDTQKRNELLRVRGIEIEQFDLINIDRGDSSVLV